MTTKIDMGHLGHIEAVAVADCEELRRKEKTYRGSWKKRGGVGAWMMIARKIDRLEEMLGDAGDIFEEIALQPAGKDGSVLAEVRDLRRYLLLVEAEVCHRWAIRDMGGPGTQAAQILDDVLSMNETVEEDPGVGVLSKSPATERVIAAIEFKPHPEDHTINEDRRTMLKKQRAEMLAEAGLTEPIETAAVLEAIEHEPQGEDIGDVVGRKIEERYCRPFDSEAAERVQDLTRALESEENLAAASASHARDCETLLLDILPMLKNAMTVPGCGKRIGKLASIRASIQRIEALTVPPGAIGL